MKEIDLGVGTLRGDYNIKALFGGLDWSIDKVDWSLLTDPIAQTIYESRRKS